MLFNTPNKALETVSKNMKDLRLSKGLTQEGLASRSGVSLSSLRKFEQSGIISLESFFKLASVLGCLDKLIEATKPEKSTYTSIDDVLNQKEDQAPKRGWRK